MEQNLEIIIYYRNLKTKNLIMKNDLSCPSDRLLTSWTVYKYVCDRDGCELPNPSYILDKLEIPSKRD